jgi:hypothetical protein
MSDAYDFERVWLGKLSTALEQVAGAEVRLDVMKGSEALSSHSSREEVIVWSQRAMERLEALLYEGKRREIMTGCACRYPESGLQEARAAYQASGSINEAHRVLLKQFDALLRDALGLSDDLIEEVVSRGWGSAGVRQGNRIVATKIPKSGHLVTYMQEDDPEERRQLYCHCPRIRQVLKTSQSISPTYCYCGAGFYKGMWEEILQEPVEVEVLKSVLAGDDVCTIAVHLPALPGP